MEVRVFHVCCERVIRILETQVVDDSSCAQSRAWRERIIHRLVTLEFSCDESCSDSVLPVVRVPTCHHSLLPEIILQVHSFVQCKTSRQSVVTRFFPRATCRSTVSYTPNSASRSSTFSLTFIASSVSALSTRGSCNSPASSWSTKYSAGPHPRFQIWRFQPLSYSERPSASLRLPDALPVKARPVS